MLNLHLAKYEDDGLLYLYPTPPPISSTSSLAVSTLPFKSAFLMHWGRKYTKHR